MRSLKNTILGLIGICFLVGGAYLVANLINEQNRAKLSPSEKVLKIGTEVVDWKLYRVNQAFFIKIPKQFVKLDEATLKVKYPANDRPELVFQSSDDQTHVFVTVSNIVISDSDLATYIENTKNSLTGFKVTEAVTYQKYDKTFAKLVATDQQELGNYYDIRYFTINQKLVKVEFHTPKQKVEELEEVSKILLDSICFREEDTKKE